MSLPRIELHPRTLRPGKPLHPEITESASQQSFSDRLRGRDNAFGLLRLVFAGMVVVSHAFPVGGFGRRDPVYYWTGGQVDFGQLGLFGFFAISGYLITKSAHSLDTLAFIWRRVLRLYPAFLVALIVGAIVVGPLAELNRRGDLSGYWAGPGGPFDYIFADARLAIRQYGIHEVFLHDPYGATDGSVINGSLWTLWYEFRAYLAVGLLAALGILSKARWVVPLSFVLTFAAIPLYDQAIAFRPVMNLLIGDPRGMELLAVFLVGATIATYERRVPCVPEVAAGATLLFVATAATSGFRPLGMVALSYLTLYAAAALPAWARRVGRRNDISYGVYVYGWPVLALLTSFGVNRSGYLPYLLTALLTVAALGWLSWEVVEKHALKLKDTGPGRGWVWVPILGRRIAARPLSAGAAGAFLLAITAHYI